MPTEAKASELICPIMSREVITHCEGPTCMAWRWEFDGRSVVMTRTNQTWKCDHCGGTGSIKALGEEPGFFGEVACGECEGEGQGYKHAPVGFCGLAGLPRRPSR